MRPPFPGVDPYLEAQGYWPDFHLTFLNYWREALADGLPDDYEARVDERVNLVDIEDWKTKLIKPDIALIRRPEISRPSNGGGTLTLEPETIPTVVLEQEQEAYLKILHRPTRKLVTVLELLSPANKTGDSRRDYLMKRNLIYQEEVHLVELDLLVSGLRLPMKRLPAADFHAIVGRWEVRPDCQVYSWTVNMLLPVLAIPLRAPDPDIVINLADVYRTAFERGRYARSIDYEAPLGLPFVVG